MDMKISGSKPPGPARGVVTPKAAGAASSAPAAEVRPAAATASIVGIPETEFTPKVRNAIMGLLQEVDRFRQELNAAKNRIEHLEKLAERDPLMPILNRRGFVREMTRVKSFADRYGAPATLIFIDLNDFKSINDLYGHAAGDQVLQRIGQVLVENTRDSDVVGRLGGDEFGVILVNTPVDIANQKSQMLAEAIARQRFISGGKEYGVTAAYGTYSFVPGDDPTQVLAKADAAMYAAKRRLKTPK